jgi:hypothetical protein
MPIFSNEIDVWSQIWFYAEHLFLNSYHFIHQFRLIERISNNFFDFSLNLGFQFIVINLNAFLAEFLHFFFTLFRIAIQCLSVGRIHDELWSYLDHELFENIGLTWWFLDIWTKSHVQKFLFLSPLKPKLIKAYQHVLRLVLDEDIPFVKWLLWWFFGQRNVNCAIALSRVDKFVFAEEGERNCYWCNHLLDRHLDVKWNIWDNFKKVEEIISTAIDRLVVEIRQLIHCRLVCFHMGFQIRFDPQFLKSFWAKFIRLKFTKWALSCLAGRLIFDYA